MNKHKAYTTEEWVEMAKAKHPNIDYSESIYVNKGTKIKFICEKHGEFEKLPREFLKSNCGCTKCNLERLREEKKEKHKEEIEEIWKKRDYEILDFPYDKGQADKITVLCKKHNHIFSPTIFNILTFNTICPKCANEENGLMKRDTFEEFLEKARKVHGDKYEYVKETYEKSEVKMDIICHEHGVFKMTPHNHIGQKQGCPICGKINGGLKRRRNAYEILEEIKYVHRNDNYTYERFNYDNGISTIVEINCHNKDANGNEHGYFKQRILGHRYGQGCPKCNMSYLEKDVRDLLEGFNIEQYKKFDWLGAQTLDFYLPDYNIGIECQGRQHYESVDHFGGYDEFEIIKERDERKRRLCEENGVKLIYYTDEKFLNIIPNEFKESTFYDKETLLSKIRK